MPLRSAVVCGLALLLVGRAHADEAPKKSDLDFNLFDQPGPTNSPIDSVRLKELERSVKRRRVLLQAHQIFGFITLASLAATLVVGQLNYNDKYGGGDDNARFANAHLGLAIGTSATFATTGVLALLAPNPYPKPIKLDAALVHKVAMALATAGMVAQMVLGPITGSREGKLDQRDLALAHLITGYATGAFMSVGVLTYVF